MSKILQCIDPQGGEWQTARCSVLKVLCFLPTSVSPFDNGTKPIYHT